MPDTGAPWNIPYVENADLVSDWPADSLLVANAVAAGLDLIPAGIGSNVVQTVKTDTFTTSSTSPTNITGLTLTITPSTATSKIFLIAQIANGTDTGNQLGFFRLNGGNADDFVGDAAGSRTRTVFGGLTVFSGNNWFGTYIISYLDSPATTSPVNYAVQAWVGTGSAGTARVNFSSDSTDADNRGRGASSLIAIEVAA
jgi:hypothetical protein